MQLNRRSPIVYGVIIAAWLGIVAWQAIEHFRVREEARTAVVNRARDITTTLGVVIRSQRRFGMVAQDRIEPALNELIKSGELKSISLLNAGGAVVASAGESVSSEKINMAGSAAYWDELAVTLVNLVDLGSDVTPTGEASRPVIVMPRATGTNTDRRGLRPPWWRPSRETNAAASVEDNSPPRESFGPPPARGERDPNGRPSFGRPSWVSEEEFKSLIEKQGLHGFVMVMSTEGLRSRVQSDLWMRMLIGILGGAAAGGLALAWRSLEMSSVLQIRLVRASALNNHLKEMNLAAAGLAHETRNPLNIIRGLAQLISKETDSSPDVRHKSREITDEVDRVTAQLNEFINYSKPRELRRSAVKLTSVISEVTQALRFDTEDKHLELSLVEEGLTVEADEQLLRQVVFNLLLNAIQAVPVGGRIQIVARQTSAADAMLDIRDNGPGVPSDQHDEIFKPYFTTHQKGTGLGLAVVQKIVLAHGWDIQCLSNEPGGAIFRVSHLKVITA
ncbi:MAG: hypothetical protein EXS31_02640 [Pedosphaera sp.]|nr:hypothetical protein [Pedosphaera sp.]